MPGLSAALVLPLVIILVVVPLLIAFVIVPALRRRDEAVKQEAEEFPSLRYHVPEGQDPAAVLAALEQEGYAATLSPAPAIHEVVIPCRSGADRERARVRSVLEQARLNLEGDADEHPIRFVDEGGTA